MNNKKIISLLFGIACLFLAACGSSSSTTAPEVSSVVDANGTTLTAAGASSADAESTDIYPTAFQITFSKAMDDASVISDANVTLICTLPDGSPVSQPTIEVAASADVDYTYDVTVTDSWKYQLLECTLTVTTGVTDADGTALASDAVYTFTNACAINDDFNADSQSCWTPMDDDDVGITWEGIISSGAMVITPPVSAIVSDISCTDDTSYVIAKTATLNSSVFQVDAHLSSTDFVDGGMVLLGVINATTDEGLSLGISSFDGETYCLVMDDNDNLQAADCSDPDANYYIRIIVDDGLITSAQVSTDGDTYTDMEGGTFEAFELPSGSTCLVAIAVNCDDGADISANIEDITVTNMTSDTQY